MKQLLYLIAALVYPFTGGVALAEDYAAEDDETGAVETTVDSRRRHNGSGQVFGLVIRPFAPDDSGLNDDSVQSSISVDQSQQWISIIREGNPSPRNEHLESWLLNVAVTDASTRGDLKLVIDLPWTLDRAVRICANHGFRYWRTIARDGHTHHEFLADLHTGRHMWSGGPSWST